MMKRIVLSVILILSIILPLNSAVIMTKDNVDHGDFRSPGRLVDIEKTIHFGFEAEIVSDIDELDFLTDPVSAFDDSVEVVADYLASQDISFWYHNPDIISALSSIDSAFPSISDGEDLFIAEIKDYFKSRFLSDEYGSANRTHAMADVFSSGIYPPLLSSSVGGDMDLAFRLYGGKISHGSGWDLRFDLYLDSLDSLLASYKDGEYEYGNNLVAELSMNIGSAEYVIDDVLSVGISVSPNIFFKTSFLNSDLINARLDDQILSIFASNNYYFGAGIGLNFGIMYKPQENLSFTLDLRNAPSMRGAIYFSAQEINDLKLHADKNIYFVPPDIAATVRWDYGVWHIEGEIGDILSQLVWKYNIPRMAFSWQYIPKIKVIYDMSETLSLSLAYEYDKIALGFIMEHFTAELLTKTDNFAFGISMRCEF